MPSKLWKRATMAAVLAPALLLAACSGPTDAESSSPPASTEDPAPTALPSAPPPTPPATQPPSIAEAFILRV